MCKCCYYVHVPLTLEAAEDWENLYRSPDSRTTVFTEAEFTALQDGVFREFSDRYHLLIDVDEEAGLEYEDLDDAIGVTEEYLAKSRSDVERSALRKLLDAMRFAKKTGYYVDIDAFTLFGLDAKPVGGVKTSDETWRPETGAASAGGVPGGGSIRSRFGSGPSLDVKGLAAFLEEDARAHGIQFMEDGWPQFPKGMLLDEEPADMLPWRQRHAAADPACTVVCHFDSDEENYRRMARLDEDLPEYRRFMGMAGFDLSPRIQWDEKLQRFNILLSMLATLYVGNRGVKVMPNFRTGDSGTFESLNAYPHDALFAVGSLGCADGHVELNDFYLRMKSLVALPKKLFYYGTLRDEYRKTLDDVCLDYKVFPDLRSRTFHRDGSDGAAGGTGKEADDGESA